MTEDVIEMLIEITKECNKRARLTLQDIEKQSKNLKQELIDNPNTEIYKAIELGRGYIKFTDKCIDQLNELKQIKINTVENLIPKTYDYQENN